METTQHNNIKKRILVPVVLSIIMITGLAVVGAYWQKSQNFSQKADAQVSHISQLLETTIESDTQLLNALLDSIEQDPAIQKAWMDKDKQALFETTQSLFQYNRAHYRVTHLYFTGLDKVVFLRGHNPAHSGDLKTILLMQQASKTGQITSGLELGKYGTFTLRVIRPWHIDGQLVGYIELGEEITHILDRLGNINNTQLLVTINKQFLDQQQWQKGQKSLGHEVNWEQFSDFTLSPEHKHEVNITLDFEQRLNTLKNSTLYTHINYLQYQTYAIPLLDVTKRRVGNIFTIHDNTETQKVLNTYITILIFIAVIITAILSVFFFIYTAKIESDLNQSGEMAAQVTNEEMRALASSNEFKSSFLAHISHEIRTPLNGVSGMLQLLKETKPLTEEQKMFLETACSSEELLMTLLNDLLDLSKAEAGKLRLENINFDIIKLCKDVTDLFQPMVKQKNVILNSIIDPGTPRFIDGDPTRTRQILNNLISNAIKFTAHGEVKLEIRSIMPDDNFHTLLFEVSDTGIGIPKDKKDHIFESFSQADDSTTREYGGTGLGLPITKYLIHLMGGELYVQSTPGEGSKFSFTIPMQEKEKLHLDKLAHIQNKNIRVLVAGHNKLHYQTIWTILDEAGITCYFENIDAVKDKLLSATRENIPFHIVILDTMLLASGETNLAKDIKADEKLKDTPLILLVKTGIRGDASDARKAGFQGYLTSPLKSREILKCINTILELPDVQQQNILVTRHLLDELEDSDFS